MEKFSDWLKSSGNWYDLFSFASDPDVLEISGSASSVTLRSIPEEEILRPGAKRSRTSPRRSSSKKPGGRSSKSGDFAPGFRAEP